MALTPVSILRSLSEIPATPFLIKPRLKFIRHLLGQYHVPHTENAYSLIVTIPGLIDRQLVLISHLDHPGIIVRDQCRGVVFGSLYQNLLSKTIAEKGPIDLDIFSPDGKLITSGHLLGFEGQYLQKAKLDISTVVPINSHAAYHLSRFSQNKDKLQLYAADNDVPTATLLSILTKNNNKPYFTIKIVFTFFEEVHQISSFFLASRNVLNLTQDDLILNLECKKVKVHHSRLTSKIKLNYQSGPVLEFSEEGCRYGYHFGTINKLEQLITIVARKYNIPLQIGPGSGSTDARSFSNFSLTPHICTLSVPNKNKHNVNEFGYVVPETILKKDINYLVSLLTRLMYLDQRETTQISESSSKTMSSLFTRPDILTNRQLMEKKINLNQRLGFAYHQAIFTGEYFQNNLGGIFTNWYYKIISYLAYFYTLITSLPSRF